jgi:hypothetical protein
MGFLAEHANEQIEQRLVLSFKPGSWLEIFRKVFCQTDHAN